MKLSRRSVAAALLLGGVWPVAARAQALFAQAASPAQGEGGRSQQGQGEGGGPQRGQGEGGGPQRGQGEGGGAAQQGQGGGGTANH